VARGREAAWDGAGGQEGLRRVAAEIPVVEYGLSDSTLGRRLDEALGVAGLAILRNHPLRRELMDEMFVACRQFFSAPEGVKSAVAWPGDGRWRGFFAVEESSNSGEVELVERLEYGRPDLYDVAGSPGWPAEPVRLRHVWSEYYLGIESIIARLLRCASLNGVLEAAIIEAWSDRHESNLSANCYLNHQASAGVLGMKPHTDFGGLTVLAADGSWPHFEAFIGDAWRLVAFEPHDVVLQVGDLLSAASDGRWPATLHRVSYDYDSSDAPDSAGRRISLAYFHIPDASSTLAPNSVLPVATTVGEYIRSRMLSY
jgi:isopenicillin N synthase-like dioxygenase